VLPQLHPTWEIGTRWGVGLGIAIGFAVVSVLRAVLHRELVEHRVPAPQRVRVFGLGSDVSLDGRATTPYMEMIDAMTGIGLRMTIAVTLVVAGVRSGGGWVPNALDLGIASLEPLSPVSTTLIGIGAVEVLGAFLGLLPSLPFAGGRLLRAALWATWHDRERATRVAVLFGRGFGWGVALAGLAVLIVPMGGGDASPTATIGLGLIVFAWYLNVGWATSVEQIASEHPPPGPRRSSRAHDQWRTCGHLSTP
jgi:hypothetical protein